MEICWSVFMANIVTVLLWHNVIFETEEFNGYLNLSSILIMRLPSCVFYANSVYCTIAHLGTLYGTISKWKWIL